jgi:hypothetical protein
MTENLALVAIKQIQRARLVVVFGNAGAMVILDHFAELERIFVCASSIILRIMESENAKEVTRR